MTALFHLLSIGPANGMSPLRRQAIHKPFIYKNMASVKWRLFPPGEDELNVLYIIVHTWKSYFQTYRHHCYGPLSRIKKSFWFHSLNRSFTGKFLSNIVIRSTLIDQDCALPLPLCESRFTFMVPL